MKGFKNFLYNRPKYRQHDSVQGLTFNGNYCKILFMNHHKDVSKFILWIKGLKPEKNKIIIDFSETDNQFFPNPIVPITAIYSYYRNLGVDFDIKGMPQWLSNMGVLNPKVYNEEVDVLNQVWIFNQDNVGRLQNAILKQMGQSDIYPNNFLESNDWALGELMDNVLIHSNKSEGYIMGQVHKKTKHVTFTICDLGQGIYNSLKGSKYHVENELDAIKKSLKESVTNGKGMGNGLFGLATLIKQGDSRLHIASGRGFYSVSSGRIGEYDNCPRISKSVCMTTVDYVLDYSGENSWEDILVFNGRKINMVNLRLDEMEDVETGVMTYKVKDEVSDTSTRNAGERVYNDILNILSKDPRIIVLDFSESSVFTSSFADELLAKLFMKLGLFQFLKVIKLKGITFNNQKILQNAIIKRIVTTTQSEKEDNIHD